MSMDFVDADAEPRSEVGVVRGHAKFLLKELSFTQQFSHMYFSRLSRLTPKALETSEAAGLLKTLRHSRVLQLQPGKRGLIVGTLFKQLTSVTSFLREYTKELVKLEAGGEDGDDEAAEDGDDEAGGMEEVSAPPPSGSAASLVSETDSLIVEDDSGRVELVGLDPSKFVTGVVLAVVGTLEEKGKLRVEQVFLPSPAAVLPRTISSKEPCYVAFLSGLNVSSSGEVAAATALLVDYLSGNLGNDAVVRQAKAIGRLVIGGNIIEPTADSGLKHKIRLDHTDHTKPNYDKSASTSANAMRHADALLRQLAATVEVEVMPGDSDPTNCFQPQQPIHPMLLRNASRQSTLKLVTNPYEATFYAGGNSANLTGALCLMSSGQAVDDVKAQSQLDTLEAMESMLRWGLMCPTAPNSLACYPFKGVEPFVIDQLPHVYVSCNQATLAIGTAKIGSSTVRTIAVPCFEKTGQLVLLNLNSSTLDTTVVNFLSMA